VISTSRPTFLRKSALAAIAALALVAGALISVPTAASAAETGSITGTAFFGAALQSSGTVYLHAHGNANAIVSSPVSNGSFGFTALADGQYDLEFDDATHNGAVSPSQWYRTGNSVAEVQGDATAVTVAGGAATSVSINRTIGGTIAGSIVDADGVAITSARVTLYSSTGNEVASEIFATSAFSIAGLKGDTYKLKVTTAANIGSPEWYSNATSQATATGIVVTRESTANTGAIALDYSQAVGTFSGTIRDTVTSMAVPSVTLELKNQSNVVVATKTTDFAGAYTFDHLADGQYTLTATPTTDSGFKSKVLDTEIQMPNGNVPTEYYLEAVSLIQGFVRKDEAPAFEALGGRTVELYAAPDYSTVVKEATTIASGNYKGYYLFRGVDAGTYKIKIIGNSGLLTRWVGNTATSAGATEIVFGGAGAIRNNLQTMLPVSSYINGTLTAAPGAPTNFGSVSAVFWQNGEVVSTQPAHGTGEWSSGPLAPGTYTVSFVATSGFTNASLAEATGSNDSEVTVSGGTTTINNVMLYGAFSSFPTPTITDGDGLGDGYIVGDVLTAHSAAWTPAADVTYAWFDAGSYQLLAEGDTYTVTADVQGYGVFVRAYGNRLGYTEGIADDVRAPVDDPAKARVVGSVFVPQGAPAVDFDDIGVRVVGPGGWQQQTAVESDGSYSFYNLDTGDYTFEFGVGATDSSVFYQPGNPEGAGWATTVQLSAGKTTLDAQGIYGRYTHAPEPSIEGDPVVGNTLTADIAAWVPATSFLYTWFAWDDTQGEWIVLQEQSSNGTYLVKPGDLDREIRVEAQPTKAGYVTLADTRASDSVTVLKVFTSTPIPVISGTLAVGSELTASTPAWTPAAEEYSYAWLRDGEPVGVGPSYIVQAGDSGGSITAISRGSSEGYLSVVVVSDPVSIPGTPFVQTAKPTISGTPKVGSKLTASVGAWTPAATSSTFRWYRAGQPIAGATSATYTLAEADGGKKLSVRVTGSLATYQTTTVSSAELAIAKAVFSKSPVPTISGSRAVGTTLKAVTGTWTPAASFTYQWSRNGVAIATATASTYKVVAADAGKKIAVRVTGARLGFETLAKSSAQSTVALQKLTKTPKPTISGTAKKGKTLKVKAGSWAPATVSLTYQWERNGKKIAKATKASYKLTSKDKGKKITVVVTGKKAGFTTVAKESSAKKVKK